MICNNKFCYRYNRSVPSRCDIFQCRGVKECKARLKFDEYWGETLERHKKEVDDAYEQGLGSGRGTI